MRTRPTRFGTGAAVGLLAAGVALGVSELVAAFVRPAAAPVIAVGNKFILLTPEPVKAFAIRNFGTNDKNVLLAGIYAVIAALAIALGIVALRRLVVGIVGLCFFGAVGTYSALTTTGHRASDVVPTLVGVSVAIAVLVLLVGMANGAIAVPRRGIADRGPDDKAAPDASGAVPRTLLIAGAPRRTFLIAGAATAGVAAVAGSAGRTLQRVRFDASGSRAAVKVPKPVVSARPLPAGVDLGKSGVPFVTSNADFYRVDTAISVPQLDAQTWQLTIGGKVDTKMTLSFDDLLRRPLIERYITLICVSNEVGDRYVSTAKFLGVPLAPMLSEAGVHADADQILGTSSDGMTIGTPTSVIMDGRDAMLAVGMNDAPLPVEHGFPVRMVVPGLYGYVSATKWLISLEATTFADREAYWVKEDWAAKGPILTQSRIDTPKRLGRVTAGRPVPIAGVAWSPTVGISMVEVQVDDGPWTPARLALMPSADTWVQWLLPWTPSGAGTHTIRVRATDGRGQLQDETRRSPFPSGATGWHSVVVQARD
ncbi:MAG: molybdopterin-dependent oxidoreductase [Actinomycetota bacterium]